MWIRRPTICWPLLTKKASLVRRSGADVPDANGRDSAADAAAGNRAGQKDRSHADSVSPSPLECDYVIQTAFKMLKRVHAGELPFDRTVQVSVTDRLEKEQILGRFPHNLRTMEILLQQNRDDYRTAISKKQQHEAPPRSLASLGRRRRRAVRLVEELGLRTQRIEPMIRTLENSAAAWTTQGRDRRPQEGPRPAGERKQKIDRVPQHSAGHARDPHQPPQSRQEAGSWCMPSINRPSAD